MQTHIYEQRKKYQALFDSIPQNGLKCDILFLVIKNRIQDEPEYVKKLRVVFQFNITKDGKIAAIWTSDTRTSIDGEVYRSLPRNELKPDCMLTVDDDDWVKIMVGKLNPQRAFMLGKFKIKGNIMLLQKLHALWFDLRRKGKTLELDLIKDIIVNDPIVPGLKSEAMAVEIVQRIVKSPHFIETINADVQINIEKNGKLMTQYFILMKPSKRPEFKRLYNTLITSSSRKKTEAETTQPSADVTFTVDDDDLVLIIYGICKLDEAIESRRVRIDGNFELVERAKALFELPPIMARL